MTITASAPAQGATTTIAAIRTEEDHRAALREAEALFAAEPGTPEFAHLNALVDTIEAYERTIFTLPPPSAEAIAEHELTKLGVTAEV